MQYLLTQEEYNKFCNIEDHNKLMRAIDLLHCFYDKRMLLSNIKHLELFMKLTDELLVYQRNNDFTGIEKMYQTYCLQK